MNALQAHRPSIYVHALPVPLLAQGGRLAGRSSVSSQVAAARKRAVTVLVKRENARDLEARNACVAGAQYALVLCFPLVCWSDTPVFGLSPLEI
jgi:hypothetical protein